MTHIIPIHRCPESLRMKAVEIDKQGNNNLVLDTEQEIKMFRSFVKEKSPATNINACFYNRDEENNYEYSKIYRARRDAKRSTEVDYTHLRFDGYVSCDSNTETSRTYYDKNFHKFAGNTAPLPIIEITDLNAYIDSGFSKNYKYDWYYYKGHAASNITRLDDGRFILDTEKGKVYVNKEGDIVDYKTWRTNWEAVKDGYNSLVEGISSFFE